MRWKQYNGLLDLYKQEKEKNAEIKNKLEEINVPVETLLAEFDRLENVEHRLDVEKEKNKQWEDKIREKIDYWKQEHYIAGEHLVVEVLQELLEE